MHLSYRCVARVVAAFVIASGVAPWASQVGAQGLPPSIDAVVRKQFVLAGTETRYLDGSFDLNADGKPEVIVHLVGGGACGSGGCTTLVFTPEGSGYRLVTTMSVSRPPIRAAAASTSGWRNLIVQIGGAGANLHDVELTFDGKSYPANPTVPGPRAKTATLEGATVIIKEVKTTAETKSLRGSGAAPSAAAAPARGAGPSFDCTKATGAAEKLVCGDAELSSLDRSLNDAYAKAMAAWPDEIKTEQRAVQRNWVSARDACEKNTNPRACAVTSYRRRAVEVRIQSAQKTPPTRVSFTCAGPGNPTLIAAHYNQTEPRSAVLTMGDRVASVVAAPAASGVRYQANGIDFVEKQGEATLIWSGGTFTCKPR